PPGRQLVPAAAGLRPAAAGLLAPDRARDLLAGAGIPVTETIVCDSAAAAAAAAGRLGYPVVVKVVHSAFTHKSDVGGVRLGLVSAGAVWQAAGELLALADGAAVLVQRQQQGIELVVGGIRDQEFGPVVLAGLGGVLVETRRDVQLAVAPVDEAQAIALLRSLRGAAVFDGLRGARPVDLGAAAAVITSVARLITDVPEIAE